MTTPRAVTALLCALTLGLTACGDDEDPTPVAVPDGQATTNAPRPNLETDADGAFDPSPPAPQPTEDGCGRVDGGVVEIVAGDVPCETALAAISAYDLQGPKVQEVEGFTCESGEAATRPVVLVCTGPDGEVALTERGG